MMGVTVGLSNSLLKIPFFNGLLTVFLARAGRIVLRTRFAHEIISYRLSTLAGPRTPPTRNHSFGT